MIPMIFQRILLFVVLSFSALKVAAQSGITINASVDKNKILIGEPIQLTIEENVTAKRKAVFFNVDSISHFEFLGKPLFDTINNNKVTTIRAIYKITSFDSGHWMIPSFAISRKIKTTAISVDVVFSNFDPNQPYHDIKGIIEVNPEKEQNDWWWYMGAGATIIVIIIIWLLTRKKKPAVSSEPIIDPYKEAMQNLKQIRKKNISGKEYYSEIVNIFRQYIAHKKNIQSFQKTTNDLVIQLQKLNMNKDQFSQLSDVLRLSDWVKFAKYIPTKEDDQTVFETIKKTIQSIEQMNS